MHIEITDKQREQLRGILATHLHNMRNAYVAAHGIDEKRSAFYYEKMIATELLLPIFAALEEPGDEDDQEGAEGEDAL